MLKLLIFTFSVVLLSSVGSAKRPLHIILIIGDDVGFNDVSYRGSEDIHTPNIDALGYAGRILDRHYVLPTCTPSRASLLTGQYAVRTGMQGFPLKMGEPRGLPLNFQILPQFLKKLNYSTHLIGKWHEGNHRWDYTPTNRGFDTFLGFYNGMIGYFSHEVAISDWPDPKTAPMGFDMHRNKEVAFDLRGRYATDLFTAEAEKLILEHNPDKPLFLEISHIAPHVGQGKDQNEVPNEAANNRRFGFIKDVHRRRYAGAMAALDDSVGRVIDALADRDMLTDSLVVFLSDNGGATVGRFNNSGSNWPLRGQKETVFEGAVRGAAVVWHKCMKPTTELHTDLFHITDWLPTFYEAAGGNISDLGEIDGVSQWGRLSGRRIPPPRNEVFVNSREGEDAAYIDSWWKYVVGNPSKEGVTESFRKQLGDQARTKGRQPYNICGIANSATSKHLFRASAKDGFDSLAERAAQLRKAATLPPCRNRTTEEIFDCTDGCLFNLHDDPCETTNLVKDRPEIVSSLLLKLRSWDSKIVPQLNTAVDFSSNPQNFGGAWVAWLDLQPTTTPKPVPTNQSVLTDGSSKSSVQFLLIIYSVMLVFCLRIQ